MTVSALRPTLRSRLPIQAWTTIGMIGSGAGYFVLISSTSYFLIPADSSSVLLWNSASMAVGLFIASPTVALMIIRQGRDPRETSTVRANVQRASTATAVIAGLVLPFVWLSSGSSTGSLAGNVLGCLLLASSPVIQVLGATQRGILAASNRWHLVAAQLVLDGAVRAILALTCGALSGTVMTMLIASWLPLPLAIAIVRQVSKVSVLLIQHANSTLTEFRTLIPLWVTGFAEHSVLTLSPNYVALFSNNLDLIVAFSLLMYCVRIPITLSNVVLTPFLVKLSTHERTEYGDSRLSLVRIEVIFLVAAVPLIILGSIVGPILMGFLFNNSLLSDSTASALATITMILFLLALTVQQILWSRSRFPAVAGSWILAVVAYLALTPFAYSGLTGLMIVMALAGTVAAAAMSIAARRADTT